MGPVRHCEMDVGDAHLQVAAGALLRLAQGRSQQFIALGRNGREQPCFVGEMVGRRGVRDPDPTGERTEAELRRSFLGNRGQRGVQQGAAQVAVVVRVAASGRTTMGAHEATIPGQS
jgi:hypothetical protein